jgi:hypothetical protein
VLDSSVVDVVVTQITDGERGDQVNFTLSTYDTDNVNGMAVRSLLTPGWLVLEAEVQHCDESRDASSAYASSEYKQSIVATMYDLCSDRLLVNSGQWVSKKVVRPPWWPHRTPSQRVTPQTAS